MREKYYWLNEESLTMLQRGYLLPNQTVQDKLNIICEYASDILEKPELKEKFLNIFERGWASLSSPVWANFGETRGFPISCFSSFIPDSLSGIYDGLKEVAVMTKGGGGTAGYFNLRPKGSSVSGGAVSSGAVSFIKLFDQTVETVMQNGVRRGAFAAYMDINHPEILDFLKVKDKGNSMQTINTGVNISDSWMKEMIDGDSSKRKVWAEVLKSRREKGIPYINFIDTINKNKPEVYIDNNLEIVQSNLCVAPYTKVLTDNGYEIIENLNGQLSTIWNGEEWSEVKVTKTGTNSKLYRVSVTTRWDKSSKDFGRLLLEDSRSLDCTKYHKWYLKNGDQITTKDLKIGDELLSWTSHEDKSVTYTQTVESIEEVQGLYDTYCFTEPKRNMGIFNGILTGNCNEIMLPTSEEESLVCCLSSLNLENFHEWKDTDTVETMIYFLDAVMEDFIRKSEGVTGMERAHKFAKRHRALGLGVLGWHSFLQKNMIPFESLTAQQKNHEIFSHIYEKATNASKKLAKEYGEPELLKGYGLRNTTLIAVAPTTSSSSILGQVSPSIEPFKSNYYVAKLAKGSFPRKNKYLEELLEAKGKNTPEIWLSISSKKGSVQHLDFLSKEEKDVFKTFQEISPLTIIQQASVRQKFIDQGQSLNLMIPSSMPIKEINKIHISAWELGVKSLYYQRGTSVAKEEALKLLECSSCSS